MWTIVIALKCQHNLIKFHDSTILLTILLDLTCRERPYSMAYKRRIIRLVLEEKWWTYKSRWYSVFEREKDAQKPEVSRSMDFVIKWATLIWNRHGYNTFSHTWTHDPKVQRISYGNWWLRGGPNKWWSLFYNFSFYQWSWEAIGI